MNSAFLKNKLIWIILTIGAILISIFSFGLYPKSDPQPVETQTQVQEDNNGVKVISTNLEPGDVAIISPTQSIEITFNKPMVTDNTRISIDPQIGYKTSLSADHKTIKITPDKILDLGEDYVITIKSGYGTDTGEKLESDQVFHVKTIEYKGV